MKKVFIDIETTGIHESCAIIQLGGIIEIDGKVEDTFNYKIQPLPDDQFEPAALKVNGLDSDNLDILYEDPYIPAIEAYADMERVFKQFIDPYKKCKDHYDDRLWFIGYNALHFDWPFMRNWAVNKLGQKYFTGWFWTPIIDVFPMAGDFLMKRRCKMKNFKLGTVCEAAGIEIDESKLHDALFDVTITRELYNRISVWNLIPDSDK